MTDSESFEWRESDEKYTEYEAENELPVSTIYSVNCPECDGDLYNEGFVGDADDPVWEYKCRDCGIGVSVSPTKVAAWAYDSDI